MFKILTYKQFESQQEEFYWKEITKPAVYPSTNHSNNWIEIHMTEILGEDGNGNDVKFNHQDWDFKTRDYEIDTIEKKIIDLYQSDGKIYLVADDYKTYELISDIEVKVKGKRLYTKDDPYGEEVWENKINEIFDTEKTYPYQFVTKRSWMKPFVDYVYKFTSKDNITYYVTLSLNTDWGKASIKFTDESNYRGIMNKIKDKYINLDKHDAINVLNTVFKIGKDYYEQFKDRIKEVTTNTLDEKRLNIYKYLFGKYFKGWKMNSYTDVRGEFVIEFKPPVNKNI